MNLLPDVINPTAEVATLLKEIDTIKEESKLFQFLNGLNDEYNAQKTSCYSKVLVLLLR